MRTRARGIPLVAGAAALLALAGAGMPFRAQQAKTRRSTLDDLVFSRPEIHTTSQPQPLNEVRAEASSALTGGFDQFVADQGGAKWNLLLDRMTGRPALLEGAGIPWIPGTANAVRAEDLGLSSRVEGKDVPVDRVARKALRLIRAYPDLLGVQASDLVLRPGASGPVGDYLYYLDFQWTYHGIPVEGAHVVFRLNHGNLVQIGEENICDSIGNLDWIPSISPDGAWDSVWGYAGGRESGDKIVRSAELRVIPVQSKTAVDGDLSQVGSGTSYRLVYVMAFSRPGVMGTWEAKVDAHTGEILSFVDSNKYGSVHGGVYTTDKPATEVDRPLAYADLGGGQFANGGGFFSGTSATSALNGKYVRINDTCGSISNSTSNGDLNFGSSGGTDCATPGFGGAGNTHASRTQYYNVNMIRQKALTYMPANGWLNSQVTDNVNLNQTCNAYWNGSSLNFFHQGGGCGNTGEIMGVSMHEWGHGMDQNDGNGFSPDNGTGETYGDWTATLQTHASCVGAGFFLSGVCGGYGNPCLSCTAVRDLDYAKHSNPVPAVPTQLSGSAGYHCGLDPSYPGPCGYEGHCESAISSQALWDLANRDLITWGLDSTTAWELVDKLWYRSRPTATGAYSCPSLSTTNGCGAGSLFSVLRAVDDDDGNLSNGTPHASAIYAAFNRHAIACNGVNNSDYSACGAIGVPSVYTVLGNNSVTVNWTAASGAVTYDVYRNEISCGAGYTKVGTVAAPAQTFTDNSTVGGITYYYRVQAVGSSAACAGAMSNCSTVGGPLVAYTNVVPMSGTVPLAVSFSTTGANGTPPYTSYTWNFGDGSPAASGPTASHTYTSTGVFNGSMTIKDSATPQASYTQPFTVTVTCPVITPLPATIPTLVAGTNYSIPFSASGGTAPYTFSESGTLPSGMTFSGSVLSGTPVVVGDFPISVTATDAYGCTGTANYTLHIICPVITLSPASMPGCVKGEFFSKTLTASGGIGSYTFQVTSGVLPPGLTLSSGGVLSGTATATGTWTFTVTALDVNLCPGTATYTFSVFDIAFWDDYGAAALCVTFSSGQYAWTLLTGPHAGTTYSGIAAIFNGGAKISSKAGDPNYFSMTYDPVRKRASGWLVSGGVYSKISDSNTTNDPGGCS